MRKSQRKKAQEVDEKEKKDKEEREQRLINEENDRKNKAALYELQISTAAKQKKLKDEQDNAERIDKLEKDQIQLVRKRIEDIKEGRQDNGANGFPLDENSMKALEYIALHNCKIGAVVAIFHQDWLDTLKNLPAPIWTFEESAARGFLVYHPHRLRTEDVTPAQLKDVWNIIAAEANKAKVFYRPICPKV